MIVTSSSVDSHHFHERGGQLVVMLKDGSRRQLLRCDTGRTLLGRRYSNSIGDGLKLLDTAVPHDRRLLGFAIVAVARGNLASRKRRHQLLNLAAAQLSSIGVLPHSLPAVDNSLEHETLGMLLPSTGRLLFFSKMHSPACLANRKAGHLLDSSGSKVCVLTALKAAPTERFSAWFNTPAAGTAAGSHLLAKYGCDPCWNAELAASKAKKRKHDAEWMLTCPGPARAADTRKKALKQLATARAKESVQTNGESVSRRRLQKAAKRQLAALQQD